MTLLLITGGACEKTGDMTLTEDVGTGTLQPDADRLADVQPVQPPLPDAMGLADGGDTESDSHFDGGDTEVDSHFDGGLVPCDDGLVDLATDPFNCGACGIRCEGGQQCVDGHCTIVCSEPQHECSGRCVDLSNCEEHCGRCCITCFCGQRCSGGHCVGVGILSPLDLHQALQNKTFLLIDVGVMDLGRIPHTDARIPNEQIEDLAQAIGPDIHTRAVFYCRTTVRSIRAIMELRDRGYTSISYLEGGISAWIGEGYDVEH